jgi:hypothetical protein
MKSKPFWDISSHPKRTETGECIWCSDEDMNLQKILGSQHTTYTMPSFEKRIPPYA